MADIGEAWQKEMQEKIKDVAPEHIPALIKRCPQCKNLSLEFDAKTGTVKCTKCGFEQKLKVMQ